MHETSEFDTMKLAYEWVNGRINEGLKIQPCVLSEDRLARYRPRGGNARIFSLFGATLGADKVVKNIEPDGKWRVEIEEPGAACRGAGFFSPPSETHYHRCSLWYSRFLPYAVGMMLCEDGFDTEPVCHTSINGYYGTVNGFWMLGQGDGHNDDPEYWRIDKKDVELFSNIYETSMSLQTPSLPFDNSFFPCSVYVAIFKPEMVTKFFPEGHDMFDHIRQVCEEIGEPDPFA